MALQGGCPPFYVWNSMMWIRNSILNYCIERSMEVEPIRGAKLYAAVTNARGRTMYGEGCNSLKSHPFQAKYSPTPEAIYWHAETRAIRQALNVLEPDELVGCVLYVARTLSDGTPAPAYPCPGCRGAIEAFGLQGFVCTYDERMFMSKHMNEQLGEYHYIESRV